MQAVILCGGLGTRLGRATRHTPKSMVPIQGQPFLLYQLELLKSHHATEILLCTGHLGQQIKEQFQDGREWRIHIQYSDDGERLLGTAGAIKQSESLLEERFFVINGDTFLPIDFEDVMARFEESGKQMMMVVYQNRNRYDTSNVILDDNLVSVYAKEGGRPNMAHIDAGVLALRKEALKFIPSSAASSLETLYHRLIGMRELAAYETQQRFYEVGSPTGLEEFRSMVTRGQLGAC